MTPVRWRLLFIGLTTLLLLAASLRAGGPDRYVVSAFNPAGKRGPIFPGNLGRADVPVEQVTIVAEIRPLAAEGAVRGIDEATYCAWAEIRWPNGTTSGNEQDCPPWDEWVRQVRGEDECEAQVIVTPPGFDANWSCTRAFAPQRRWQWSRWFGATADILSVPVEFRVGKKRLAVRDARFMVAGATLPE